MADLKQIIPHIAAWEGGLSRATTDTASKNPAPWLYKGHKDWHTNKGVTYKTFIGMASKLGYQPSAENFFLMPQDIWMKIYKVGYWDPMALDSLKSQALASVIVDYAWLFGIGGAQSRIKAYLEKKYSIKTVNSKEMVAAINKLTEKNEKSFFEDFIEHRRQAFLSLKQPKNEKGWMNRLNQLKAVGLTLITENKGTIGAGFFLLPQLLLHITSGMM